MRQREELPTTEVELAPIGKPLRVTRHLWRTTLKKIAPYFKTGLLVVSKTKTN
ncbi:MAG: hypothetical protein HIU83_13030 [Proteobacteria bacterium]|nr:hypothetical protein [Pseudomonadota bacterium]